MNRVHWILDLEFAGMHTTKGYPMAPVAATKKGLKY